MQDKNFYTLFHQCLDDMPHIEPERLQTLPEALQSDLKFAQNLTQVDLGSESSRRFEIRERLTQVKNQKSPAYSRSPQPQRLPLRLLKAAPAILALLVILTLVYSQPALAAVQRIFGYGYLPEAGFFRLDETRLLKEPLSKSSPDGNTVGIIQGLADNRQTRLWLTTTAAPVTLTTAKLVLTDGSQLTPQSWEISSSTGQENGLLLVYATLPPTTQTCKVRLESGLELPLAWIPASEAHLAPTAVSLPGQSRTPDQGQMPCIAIKDEWSLCAQAAFVDQAGTHLLISATSTQVDAPAAWQDAFANSRIQLLDENGQAYSLLEISFPQDPNQPGYEIGLLFPEVRSNVDVVTLRISEVTLWLDKNPTGVVFLLPEVISGPFDLSFSLPERQSYASPTPSLTQVQNQPSPIPTPALTRLP